MWQSKFETVWKCRTEHAARRHFAHMASGVSLTSDPPIHRANLARSFLRSNRHPKMSIVHPPPWCKLVLAKNHCGICTDPEEVRDDDINFLMWCDYIIDMLSAVESFTNRWIWFRSIWTRTYVWRRGWMEGLSWSTSKEKGQSSRSLVIDAWLRDMSTIRKLQISRNLVWLPVISSKYVFQNF